MIVVYFSIRVDKDDLTMDTLMNELYQRQEVDGSDQSQGLLRAEDDSLEKLEVV